MSIKKTIHKLSEGKHVTIVALGDSITEITFHTRGRMNWLGLLEEAVFEAYGNGVCTMINSGKCASTYLESLSRLDRDVLRFEPDLVILALGMNDAGAGKDGLQVFKSNVCETIATIRQECNSEILIRTPNPVVTVNGLPTSKQYQTGQVCDVPGRPLKEYAAVLVEIAGKLNCSCVDHYTLWEQKHFSFKHPVANPGALWPRMGDAIHPGYLGHLAFFRELAPLFGVPQYFPWEEIESD